MMWRSFPQLSLALLALRACAVNLKPTRAVKGNIDVSASPFITVQNGEFFVNGSRFAFVGTNAYWLHTLNTDGDIDKTLADIASTGVKIVRAWAFNDVDTIPEAGTWFQHISNNGTITINNGTNGLQKLDTMVQLAQKHGLYLLLSLTNNWSLARNTTVLRNILSNDYGGMDSYVRQLSSNLEHDQFYKNVTIIGTFKNYISHVVSRYKNNPSILGWEIANDARCNSTLPASSQCNSTTITSWHSNIAQHILMEDPNHLVSSGNQGFFCFGCPKLFQKGTSPSPSQIPPISVTPLPPRHILNEKQDMSLGRYEVKKSDTSFVRRQQNANLGASFDGTFGVDSEDILSIPEIGFGSFQLFPDQENYGPVNLTLSPLNRTFQVGVDWIQRHIATGLDTGKPVTLLGFGLVTLDNIPAYVPFGSDNASTESIQQPFGVTDSQRDQSCRLWLGAAIFGGLRGIIQYQWGQANLTAQAGTAIPPSSNSSGTTSNQDETGLSPNDGYSILGTSHEEAIGILKTAAEQMSLTISSSSQPPLAPQPSPTPSPQAQQPSSGMRQLQGFSIFACILSMLVGTLWISLFLVV
ncbi:glycoside hydrolase superfamily [Collybia nuda]|uniref:mannan endo-1,4-beta-mannosidase n=1 Tax=Collybia nuda TaxID=64659 RepID=A0A9P5YDF4_9AGAR|nr:glycoside hydrolase superfamily [Collybia nuda]